MANCTEYSSTNRLGNKKEQSNDVFLLIAPHQADIWVFFPISDSTTIPTEGRESIKSFNLGVVVTVPPPWLS